ncbi:MAG: LytR/AlgR family response regulator transcription factor [Sphingomonadaceae bacterium]
MGSENIPEEAEILRTLIVDDEPLAVERMQVICAGLVALNVVGTASDGAAALRLIDALKPDLVLLDMTMPEVDGISVARQLMHSDADTVVIFVTAHDEFAVEAFDLDAVDYVLKPVAPERLERAIARAITRRVSSVRRATSAWLQEIWVPHRSELLRVDVDRLHRIDAERDYVRLHVQTDPNGEVRCYMLLQTIAGLEEKLDPAVFIRIHRSTILRRDRICGLRHDGLGVWSAELDTGDALRIGRTYLSRVKAIAGR